jgi:hypothetical protein
MKINKNPFRGSQVVACRHLKSAILQLLIVNAPMRVNT